MKNKIDELAIWGGSPEFESPLHVGRPNIGDRDFFLSNVNEVLDNKWLTNNGPKVNEFEKKLADYIGVKNDFSLNPIVQLLQEENTINCNEFSYIISKSSDYQIAEKK